MNTRFNLNKRNTVVTVLVVIISILLTLYIAPLTLSIKNELARATYTGILTLIFVFSFSVTVYWIISGYPIRLRRNRELRSTFESMVTGSFRAAAKIVLEESVNPKKAHPNKLQILFAEVKNLCVVAGSCGLNPDYVETRLYNVMKNLRGNILGHISYSLIVEVNEYGFHLKYNGDEITNTGKD
jgi:hypothetical protein